MRLSSRNFSKPSSVIMLKCSKLSLKSSSLARRSMSSNSEEDEPKTSEKLDRLKIQILSKFYLKALKLIDDSLILFFQRTRLTLVMTSFLQKMCPRGKVCTGPSVTYIRVEVSSEFCRLSSELSVCLTSDDRCRLPNRCFCFSASVQLLLPNSCSLAKRLGVYFCSSLASYCCVILVRKSSVF